MGQTKGAIPSGSQGFQGQINGQNPKPTRRGVKGNQMGGLKSTVEVRKPPPSGGVGLMWCCIRASHCPASEFGAKWGPGKNSQKSKKSGILK